KRLAVLAHPFGRVQNGPLGRVELDRYGDRGADEQSQRREEQHDQDVEAALQQLRRSAHAHVAHAEHGQAGHVAELDPMQAHLKEVRDDLRVDFVCLATLHDPAHLRVLFCGQGDKYRVQVWILTENSVKLMYRAEVRYAAYADMVLAVAVVEIANDPVAEIRTGEQGAHDA